MEMLEFIFHPTFEKDSAAFERRFGNVFDGLERFKKLCEVQFHPTTPTRVIAPAKLHRVTQNDIWCLWKVELVVVGLKPNQFPRVWFAVKGAVIAFLCIAIHIDNYRDSDVDRVAQSRLTDIL